jgi:hypothetical protein
VKKAPALHLAPKAEELEMKTKETTDELMRTGSVDAVRGVL